jgi:Spy/CpxP family protein refolding chaperone
MGPDHKQHRNVQNFLRNELNLSEEQLQQFKNLRKQHFEQSRFIMHEIRELKKEMMNELFESTPDTSKLEQLANEIGKRQTELGKLTSNHFLDLKSVCQVHQRRKLRALLHEFFGPPQHRVTPPRNKPGL